MVEQGGFGGITAAPIVRHIMEGLFHVTQTNPISGGP
jgi:cell division protein FtsI/penicillin-binding protein 2